MNFKFKKKGKILYKNRLKISILIGLILGFVNLGCNNIKKTNPLKAEAKIVEKKGDVKTVNKKDYAVNGFSLNVIKKAGCYKLHYTHNKTNAQFVFDLNNNFEQYNSIFFGCPPTDDKGKSHALEHLLVSVVLEKILNQRKKIDYREFNGNTNEFGFWFLIRNSIFNLDVLKFILDELKNPEFLRDNEKTFKREIKGNYKDNSQSGRMFHEMCNIETVKDFKEIDFRNLKNIRFYDSGGKSQEILKIKFEEMKDFFKTYIHPSNMLATFNCLKTSNEIKEVLKFFEQNYLKNYSKKNINLKYDLKTKEKFFKFRQWDEKSNIFKGLDSNSYTYCARVCLDVQNFNLNEKNALNIRNGVLFSFLKEEIEKLGYKNLEVNSDDVLKGRFFLKFYGNDKNKFYEQNLKDSAIHILKSAAEFLEKALQNPNNKDAFFSFNKVLAEEYYQSIPFERPDKYRKIYDMYNTCFLSFVKYKTPFSDKIFKIQNNEIIDNLEIEKQNFYDDFLGSLKKLANANFLFIDSFEKVKVNHNNLNKNPVKEAKIKIKKYKNADVFRFCEYIIFKNIFNHKISSYGLSYKNLRNAFYVGACPTLKENASSFESVEKFLNTEFKNLINNFHFSESFFYNEIVNYFKKIQTEIVELKQILNLLEKHKKFIKENKNIKNISFSRQKIVEDLYKHIKDFRILFDKKEDYENFEKNEKKYKTKYEEYFKNNLNSDKDHVLFFKEFEEYVDYETKLFKDALKNLEEKLNNIKNLNYFDVKNSIESVTYIKN